jgi:hypothetical protein
MGNDFGSVFFWLLFFATHSSGDGSTPKGSTRSAKGSASTGSGSSRRTTGSRDSLRSPTPNNQTGLCSHTHTHTLSFFVGWELSGQPMRCCVVLCVGSGDEDRFSAAMEEVERDRRTAKEIRHTRQHTSALASAHPDTDPAALLLGGVLYDLASLLLCLLLCSCLLSL